MVPESGRSVAREADILSPLIGLIKSCIVSMLDAPGLEEADLDLGETMMTVICER